MQDDFARALAQLFTAEEIARILGEYVRTITPRIGSTTTGTTHAVIEFSTFFSFKQRTLCGSRVAILETWNANDDEPSCRTCRQAAIGHGELDGISASHTRNLLLPLELRSALESGMPKGSITLPPGWTDRFEK